jgi:hypothetical protein
MTPSPDNMAASGTGDQLSKRDWIVLLLLSLLTTAVIAFGTEVIARTYFWVSKTSVNECLILDDPTRGIRGVRDSICLQKVAEGQIVEYRFNCNGFRSDKACSDKPSGAYRIAIIGSSMAMGMNVPFKGTFSVLLANKLSQTLGREVQVENYSMAFGFPRNTALLMADVLAGKPDLIVWPITAVDVKLAGYLHSEHAGSAQSSTPLAQRGTLDLRGRLKDAIGGNPFAASIAAARYFLYMYMPSTKFIEKYLATPPGAEGMWDAGPDALRTKLTKEWKTYLDEFNIHAAKIMSSAKSAGVPIAATFIPNRAQAAMLASDARYVGYDPSKLEDDVRGIVGDLGGAYLPILPGFSTVANLEKLYLPVDGHPDIGAHAIIADLLAKKLTDGSVKGLYLSAGSTPSKTGQ